MKQAYAANKQENTNTMICRFKNSISAASSRFFRWRRTPVRRYGEVAAIWRVPLFGLA
jgi:hypothetical protein